MTERKALNIALEALNDMACWKEGREVDMGFDEPYAADTSRKAITAIKEALAQPEQEPVATDWERIARVQDAKLRAMCNEAGGFEKLCEVMDKYERTTPPQRKPLTDEEIILIVADCASSHQHTDIHFARAIERAHGIKELV